MITNVPPLRSINNLTYLDLEVQHTADEAGGFTPDATRKRGLAVAVTWDGSSGAYRIYYEQDCQQLVDSLMAADCVVGFNCLRFDYEVIRGHIAFLTPRTCDLLDVTAASIGHRVPLTNLAMGTFGRGRSSDGDRNTASWASGERERVVRACKRDVSLIRRLHEHIMNHGSVGYIDGNGKLHRVKVRLP